MQRRRRRLPKVVFSGPAAGAFTGGRAEIEVTATTFRGLVRELEERFPGLGKQVEDGMAVAVDGVIYQDAYGVRLPEGAEIYLIPKIAGG
jgi:sulfur-carrier protein